MADETPTPATPEQPAAEAPAAHRTARARPARWSARRPARWPAAVGGVAAAAAAAAAVATTAARARGEFIENVVVDQPRRQGRQGRPAVLVQRARRRRRRQGEGRRRDRQGERGRRGGAQGGRGRPAHAWWSCRAPAPPSRTRSSASTAPAGCCSSRRPAVPASSPADRCARCSSAPASPTSSPRASGSNNPHNMVRATMDGLSRLVSARQVARERESTSTRIGYRARQEV